MITDRQQYKYSVTDIVLYSQETASHIAKVVNNLESNSYQYNEIGN